MLPRKAPLARLDDDVICVPDCTTVTSTSSEDSFCFIDPSSWTQANNAHPCNNGISSSEFFSSKDCEKLLLGYEDLSLIETGKKFPCAGRKCAELKPGIARNGTDIKGTDMDFPTTSSPQHETQANVVKSSSSETSLTQIKDMRSLKNTSRGVKTKTPAPRQTSQPLRSSSGKEPDIASLYSDRASRMLSKHGSGSLGQHAIASQQESFTEKCRQPLTWKSKLLGESDCRTSRDFSVNVHKMAADVSDARRGSQTESGSNMNNFYSKMFGAAPFCVAMDTVERDFDTIALLGECREETLSGKLSRGPAASRAQSLELSPSYFRPPEKEQCSSKPKIPPDSLALFPREKLRRRRTCLIAGLMKYCLFFLTFCFWVASVSSIVGGAWVLSERGHLVHDAPSFLLDPSAMLCLLGAVTFAVTFVGCLGALRENICLLKVVGMIGVLILEALIGAVVFVFYAMPEIREHVKTGPEQIIREAIVHYYDDLELQNWLDLIQRQFKCCGASLSDSGYLDWRENAYFNCSPSNPSVQRCAVPQSCCLIEPGEYINDMCGFDTTNKYREDVLERINTRGCMQGLAQWLSSHDVAIGGVSLGIIIPQIVCVVLARQLKKHIQRQRVRWRVLVPSIIKLHKGARRRTEKSESDCP